MIWITYVKCASCFLSSEYQYLRSVAPCPCCFSEARPGNQVCVFSNSTLQELVHFARGCLRLVSVLITCALSHVWHKTLSGYMLNGLFVRILWLQKISCF